MGIVLAAKHEAERIRTETARAAAAYREEGIVPKMAVLLVEGDPASAYYAEAKRKLAGRLGISYELAVLPPDTKQEQLEAIVREWSRDPDIHGILLELPLPSGLSATAVAAEIAPYKDIDGISPAGKAALLSGESALYPATPQACIRLLRAHGYELAGKHAVIVGRGQTVGLPLFHLLQREQATVTVCHSRTADLARHVRQADIVFAASGRPGLITASMLTSASVVIDAGICELANGSVVGDVAADALTVAAAVSPVPGGVGTLTTAMLFANLMNAIRLQRNNGMAASRLERNNVMDAIRLQRNDAVREGKGKVEGDTGRTAETLQFDRTIRSFVVEASAAVPTPGGGSVAALAGALATSMVRMAAGFSGGVENPEHRRKIEDGARRLEAWSAECERLLEADIACFNRYMEALRLPKASEEQKQVRRAMLRAATLQAIEVPMALMRVCRDALQLSQGLAPLLNPNLISDLGIGAILFEATAQASDLTVAINTAALQDAEAAEAYEVEVAALRKHCQEYKEAVVDIVRGRMPRK